MSFLQLENGFIKEKTLAFLEKRKFAVTSLTVTGCLVYSFVAKARRTVALLRANFEFFEIFINSSIPRDYFSDRPANIVDHLLN